MAQNEGKKKGGKNAARGARQAAQTKGDRPRKVRNSIERKIARATKSCGAEYALALRKYLNEKGTAHTKHYKCGTRFVFYGSLPKRLKAAAYRDKIRRSHLLGAYKAIKIVAP